MKTEVTLKARRSAAEESLMRKPKPKFRNSLKVWLARVRIKPGGLITAEVVRMTVISYHASAFGTKPGETVYLYTLRDENGGQHVVPPSRVFATEKQASKKVYFLLSAFADQIQKIAHEFFKLS